MKKLATNISLVFLMVFAFSSCVDDDFEIGEIVSPSDLVVTSEIVGQTAEMPYGDGSGEVKFTVTAEDAMTYKFIYGDGFEEVSYDGTTTHAFTTTGVNDYTVTVIASGTGGSAANTTTTVTVFSNFEDPETQRLLTGGDSKTWYIAAAVPGHLGVGPATGENMGVPAYYAAGPFEKAGSDVSSCFYQGEMTFSLTETGQIVYDYDNKGASFFNAAYGAEFGGSGAEDQCLPYDTSGTRSVSLSPSTSGLPDAQTTGTVLNISEGGFIGYYIGASSYEILSISEDTMVLRAIMGNNPALAWYLILTTSPDGGAEEPEEFETQYEDLVWEQDFDEGVLDVAVWNYEIGNNNGWGNQEAQYYTDDNVTVEDGNLIITAKAEEIEGFDYSSSRITTQDNFEFLYGRVEARAKLPSGGGVWPAIWMLGANYEEVGWPESGEIDILEYKGNEPGVIHGTLHYPGRSGGNADTGTTTIENAESEFHIYTVEWTPERIVFLVDGEVYHTYANSPDSPFNHEFFLILNVAMGGTFGGEIDPAFEEAKFIIDYIRVYQ